VTQPAATTQGEEPRRTKIFRKFKGVVNNSARLALPEDAWSYLENMQPIGDANVQTVANISASLYNYTTHFIYWAQYVNILGFDYLINFSTDGFVYAYSINSGTNTQIGSGFSGSGSRCDQWKNTELLVVDASGYYNWNGAGVLTLISGAGVPSSGTDIAVAFGRVWILQGRLLTGSGANDFTAASFLVANGAFTVNLTDPMLRNTVTRLKAQNGYLYLIAPTGINVISDLYVPAGATPPTPLFTNLNIQALIGSDEPGAIFPFNQALVFASHSGVWELYGTNAKKVSSDIDGTWKYIDFSQLLSGGQFLSNQILSYGMLLKRLNDPVFGSNTVLACLSDGKWWFANFGNLTFAVSAFVNINAQVANTPALFGFKGNQLYQLFGDPTTGPATVLKTPLWAMDDELSDKQVIRAGFEVTISLYGSTFSMSLDTESISVLQTGTLGNLGQIQWVNNAGQVVQWGNPSVPLLLETGGDILTEGFAFGVSEFGEAPFESGGPLLTEGTVVNWTTFAYLLYNAATPGMYGKYIGATIKSNASIYQLSSVNIDYKLRARWN
jgi:hypothetical protein